MISLNGLSDLRPLILSSVDRAIAELKKMRTQERVPPFMDDFSRSAWIPSMKRFSDHSLRTPKERVPEARLKLQERIATLLDSESFDKERLELEIAIIG